MIWRRRCLVLVPVLSFLAAALIMSCGGGSSNPTYPTGSASSILAINVCAGPPPTPTASPTPGHTPTPTPTPICTPIVTSGAVCVPNTSLFCGTNLNGQTVGTTVPFNAQGIFGYIDQPKTQKYRDVTNNTSTLWNPVTASVNFPGVISYIGNGEFVGVTTGCTYFTVSDAGFSQTILVGVNVDPATCPTPPGTAPAAPVSSGPSPTP